MASLLIVDDDRLILSTLGRGLRTAGYVVHQAASTAEALAIAEHLGAEIDLAIVDIRMPEITGIELAKLLSEKHGISSMFLSAYSDEEMVKEAVACGGVGYLVKPIDVPKLIPAVEAGLARAKDFNSLVKHKNQLENALTGGREINICIGILMERRGLTSQAAFETLRRQARSQQEKMEEVAKRIVASEELLNKAGNHP